MKRASRWPAEKAAFVVAAAAFLGSVAAHGPARPGGPVPPRRHSAETGGEPQDVAALAEATRRAERLRRVWPQPAAQSAGARWVYELFAPPALYHDRVAGTFALSPPGSTAAPPDPAPLEGRAVTSEPFRVQLAGYCGSPGEWLALFTSPGRAETWLARPGQRFGELELTLQSFDVRLRSTGSEMGPRTEGVAGVAVLLDERSGREVVLVSGEPYLAETPASRKSREGLATNP